MKKQISTILTAMMLTTNVLAQTTLSTEMPKVERSSPHGFRVSLLNSNLGTLTKMHSKQYSSESKSDINGVTGFSFGYSYLPIEEVGCVFNFSNYDLGKDGSQNLNRIDGNFAYAINRYLNAKWGVNVSNITSVGEGLIWQPGIGYQAGLGINLTKNFSMDLNYVRMSTKAAYDKKSTMTTELGIDSVDYVFQGMELGLTATF